MLIGYEMAAIHKKQTKVPRCAFGGFCRGSRCWDEGQTLDRC